MSVPNVVTPLRGHSGPLEERSGDVPARTVDKTTFPNWLMPILATILFVLLGFVYTTVDRRIEDKQREIERLERRLETQETYMKDTRERLIAAGWTVDGFGNISPPPKGVNNATRVR